MNKRNHIGFGSCSHTLSYLRRVTMAQRCQMLEYHLDIRGNKALQVEEIFQSLRSQQIPSLQQLALQLE